MHPIRHREYGEGGHRSFTSTDSTRTAGYYRHGQRCGSCYPAPRDGKSVTVDDVTPVLQELVSKAVAEIPVPKDGKDFDPATLKQAVELAVSDAVAAIPAPQDGKSVTVDDVQPMIQELVSSAIPEFPDVKSLVREAVALLPLRNRGGW